MSNDLHQYRLTVSPYYYCFISNQVTIMTVSVLSHPTLIKLCTLKVKLLTIFKIKIKTLYIIFTLRNHKYMYLVSCFNLKDISKNFPEIEKNFIFKSSSSRYTYLLRKFYLHPVYIYFLFRNKQTNTN